MKKRNLASIGVLLAAIVIGASNIGVIKAGESQAGGSLDPVVTKGYVDKEIAKVRADKEMIDLLNKELNQLKRQLAGLESGSSNDDTFELVDVKPGEKLIGRQGTEIILRSGQGTAIVTELGGLQDVTGGVDIGKGFIPKNHLLITPRDDGRGVLVTKDAIFMVRGQYHIK